MLVDRRSDCYQLQTQVFWDDKAEQDIRVIVSIDDGRSSALEPLTETSVMAPDGNLVDE